MQDEAVIRRAEDARLGPPQVDGLLNLSPRVEPSRMFATELPAYPRLKPGFCATIDVDDTATGMMIRNPIRAIGSGQCEAAVRAFEESVLNGRATEAQELKMDNPLGGGEWEPFSVKGMATPYALLAQAYRNAYGAEDENFGAAAPLTRAHALLIGGVRKPKPMAMKADLTSRMITTPLRRLAISLISNGNGSRGHGHVSAARRVRHIGAGDPRRPVDERQVAAQHARRPAEPSAYRRDAAYRRSRTPVLRRRGRVAGRGRATVVSPSTVLSAFHGQDRAEQPRSIVVLVALAEGPRMLTRMVDGADIFAGDAGRVIILPVADREPPHLTPEGAS
ncbi:hypothetical protein G5B40_15335 [Pikeienuella piscinae]|uniref:Uncharacterized protein n=1 Tax=Pikeienuella piscinae TaxID=2748098 RepID=A0A7L5BY63_9RHOB|nr:hypothetical protein [Pikeienuella piscinae]QIE56682.1 hypothetical protein G5B40_15335 [Pikeienuella piscinae]